MAQCTAQSKQSGEQCKRRAVRGKTVCSIHGGKTPTGLALPQTTHLKYSNVLPERLLPRFQASRDDPNLLAIREDIALCDGRVEDLLKRVDTGEAGETWRSLQATFRAAEKARRTWDTRRGTEKGDEAKDEFFQAFETIGDLVREGADDYRAWDEVKGVIEQRRRLVETEAKRLEKMQQMVTAEQAMALVSAVVSVVKSHVTDRNALAGIATDIRGLLSRSGSASTGAGVTN